MPSRPRAEWWARPLLWVELFALANIAFLAVDIYTAHQINSFERWPEWVPIGFSLGATVVLLVAMALGGLIPALPGTEGLGRAGFRRRVARWLGLAVGWGAVGVGVAGLLLHLDSQFFDEWTLKSLVYTAPFAAPLAYAGVGLLLILDRMVEPRSVEWARWVVLLALGGFVGNFVLSLSDHAQNGFFRPTEWVAVAGAALAVGSLAAVLAIPDRPTRRFGLGAMAAQVGVGVLGFFFHVRANLARPMETLWEDFLYGAPAFAPLLFADLALLAALGLWALGSAQDGRETEPPQPSA
jgi:hypothetical protein